jgi:AAA15 family ATPase/GTPase
MIVSFSVENWMSFRDKATLSMVASRERQHGERLARLDKYQMRLLPAAAVYGGNASGKTNLFKALAFAKTQVVTGTQPGRPIAVRPFLLDKEHSTQPTRFEFELLIDEVIYAFSFAVTRAEVIDERLVRVGGTGERTLYDRRSGNIEFDRSLKDDAQFLNFAFRGTRSNQLFLTNSVSQNVQRFQPIYDWFDSVLQIVEPNDRSLLCGDNHPLSGVMDDRLRDYDTGISRIDSVEVPFEDVQIPEPARTRIRELSDHEVAYAEDTSDNQLLVTRKEGNIVVMKRVAAHKTADGAETLFDVSDESDGSKRLINLLPVFLDLGVADAARVYVVDELDRSLHTLLSRRLLEDYLAARNARPRKQLLLTTHDVLLMDQRWFRRDEMWVTERDHGGSSSLLSFSEYRDVRYDKDIRKSYLQGRLGGIPRIVSGTT